MSKHAKPTLVRFWCEPLRAYSVLVNNWEVDGDYAKCTIPGNLDVAHWLINETAANGITSTRVTVQESDRFEWVPASWEKDRTSGVVLIRFVTRERYARDCTRSDEWVIENDTVEPTTRGDRD